MQRDEPPSIVLEYSARGLPRWAQRTTAALGWLYYLPLVSAYLWILWIGKVPDSFAARVLGILLLGLFALLWFIWFVLRFVLRRIYAVPPLSMARQFRPFLIVVAMGVLLAVMLNFEIPAYVAFHISEPAMRRKAESILVAKAPSGFPPPFFSPQRVGLFEFDAIVYFPASRAVYFYQRDGGLFCSSGWTYSPKGPPEPPKGEAGYGTQTLYEGPWYRTLVWW